MRTRMRTYVHAQVAEMEAEARRLSEACGAAEAAAAARREAAAAAAQVGCLAAVHVCLYAEIGRGRGGGDSGQGACVGAGGPCVDTAMDVGMGTTMHTSSGAGAARRLRIASGTRRLSTRREMRRGKRRGRWNEGLRVARFRQERVPQTEVETSWWPHFLYGFGNTCTPL